jgi:CubicO group peptidase (beta-lactamase class C family)
VAAPKRDYINLFLVLVIVVSLSVAAWQEHVWLARQRENLITQPPPASTDELRQRIEAVLKETHTPGAAVAIVNRQGPEWVAGIGLADVAANRPVTPETLFRIGSVSKSFISLSILKLQQEGKLSLQDTLKSRAPDLEFTNPWEATDPVRIVNLLEHTAGWDDFALREWAYNPVNEATLKEGLAYNPKSRTSRWKPGTRMAYSNSGPDAAAYVVEKITGQRFEDYVEQNWFKPLSMDTASYFETPEIQVRRTKFYHKDGRTPFPYWRHIMRPAGSILASAREMANYVQFYLNRGSFGGIQLLPPSAIERMEIPTSTYAAREGMKTGYGLSNFTTIKNRWQFHGHDGVVPGGLTELAYLPNAGVGYAFMINTGNFQTQSQINDLIQAYITRSLARPVLPPTNPASLKLAQDYAGWYEFISPRNEIMHFQTRILGLTKISCSDRGLRTHRIFGPTRDYVAVTDRLFRRQDDPVPTLALIADKSEGILIQGPSTTLRRVPAWLAWLELSVTGAAVLLMVSSLVFALVWVPQKLFGGMRTVGYLSVRTAPLLATLSIAGAEALAFFSGEDAIDRLGQVSPWSVGIFAFTLSFAVFAILGLALVWGFRKREIRRGVWWHSFLTSAVLTIVAVYLAYWGIIGLKTWA